MLHQKQRLRFIFGSMRKQSISPGLWLRKHKQHRQQTVNWKYEVENAPGNSNRNKQRKKDWINRGLYITSLPAVLQCTVCYLVRLSQARLWGTRRHLRRSGHSSADNICFLLALFSVALKSCTETETQRSVSARLTCFVLSLFVLEDGYERLPCCLALRRVETNEERNNHQSKDQRIQFLVVWDHLLRLSSLHVHSLAPPTLERTGCSCAECWTSNHELHRLMNRRAFK